jgi:hypothetical protein
VAVPPYSTRIYLASQTPAQGYVNAFQVPAAHRVVIRYGHMATTWTAGVGVQLFLASTSLELFRLVPPSNTSTYGQELRVVLHEGETLQVRALVAVTHISLHGFLLQGAGAPLVPGVLPA